MSRHGVEIVITGVMRLGVEAVSVGISHCDERSNDGRLGGFDGGL
jgi:hypothetical protein